MIEAERNYEKLHQSQDVSCLNLLSSPVLALYNHHGRWVFYTALKTTYDEGNAIQDNLLFLYDEDCDDNALNQMLLMPLAAKGFTVRRAIIEEKLSANEQQITCIEELPHTCKDTTISIQRKIAWATDPKITINKSEKGSRCR